MLNNFLFLCLVRDNASMIAHEIAPYISQIMEILFHPMIHMFPFLSCANVMLFIQTCFYLLVICKWRYTSWWIMCSYTTHTVYLFVSVSIPWKKQRAISTLIARYSIFRWSTLNFSYFARCVAIHEISCYFTLKRQNYSMLFFPAYQSKGLNFPA